MLKTHHKTTRTMILASLLLMSLFGLSACGQKGDLYLPEASQATNTTFSPNSNS